MFFLTCSFTVFESCKQQGSSYSNSEFQTYEREWRVIDFSEPAVCSNGSGYKHFFHEGTSPNLLVFFSGGGACWDEVSCSLPTDVSTLKGGFYYPEVFDIETLDIGILDLANIDNPFEDWDIIFIPYCTGDLHLGNRSTSYYSNEKVVPINYNGQANVTTSLKWIIESYTGQADKVVVAGESAGGFASIYYLPAIADIFPAAKLYQLTDCSFVKSDMIIDVMDSVWNVGSDDNFGLKTASDVLNNVYKRNSALLANRNVIFMQSNTLYDNTMINYLGNLEKCEVTLALQQQWSNEMINSTKELAETIQLYNYFVTDHGYDSAKNSTPHTMLWSNLFYVSEENNTRYCDWLNEVVNKGRNISIGTEFLEIH